MPAVAFMVMPFDRKPTGRADPAIPGEVDFDALWDRVYVPVLTEAGFKPVRADQDLGALIITEMLQRLALADLVVADITLPNANVYYEIGVRHAARSTGCVLTAAKWATPVFDLGQMRQLRFPLSDGNVGARAAASARRALKTGIDGLADGESPVFASVPGFPGAIDESRVTAFHDFVDELGDFHAEARAVGLLPARERRARVEEIVERFGQQRLVRDTVVQRIIRLLRDHVGWPAVLDYIATLPASIARHPLIVEQECLALGKTGRPDLAAARLDELVRKEGPTSERCGILGGRYKELARDAPSAGRRRHFVQLAIQSYEQGMLADLNAYYPASNLPRLYDERGLDGDGRRAVDAASIAIVACERSMARGDDEWARPTLLGLAFYRHDAASARRLAAEIELDGAPAWHLDTTIKDITSDAERCPDPERRAELLAIVARLVELLDEDDG